MLNTYVHFTPNSIFQPKAFILIKAFGRNIELRVKLSYEFSFLFYLL